MTIFTLGHCIICFKLEESTPPRDSCNTLLSGDTATATVGNSGRTWTNSEICQKFCTLVSRYLHMDHGEFMWEKTMNKSSFFLNVTQACDDCASVMQSFCELFDQWQRMELQIFSKLEEVTDRITASDKENKSGRAIHRKQLGRKLQDVGMAIGKVDRFRTNFVESAAKKRMKLPQLRLRDEVDGINQQTSHGSRNHVEEEQCSDGHYFKLERDDSSTTSDHDDLDWAEETVVKIEQQEQDSNDAHFASHCEEEESVENITRTTRKYLNRYDKRVALKRKLGSQKSCPKRFKKKRKGSIKLTDSTTEVVDIGGGITIPKCVDDFIKQEYQNFPSRFLKHLLIKGGIFTMEELASHSLKGGKCGFTKEGRKGLDPFRLQTAMNYTATSLQLSGDLLKLAKFENSIKDLCTNARKELKKRKIFTADDEGDTSDSGGDYEAAESNKEAIESPEIGMHSKIHDGSTTLESNKRILDTTHSVLDDVIRTQEDFDISTSVDIGAGITIPKGLDDYLKFGCRQSPMKFLKNLLIKGGIFTLRQLASHSLNGKKSSRSHIVREKLDPLKLNTAVDYTVTSLKLKDDGNEFLKFKRSLRDLCTNARKELAHKKSSDNEGISTGNLAMEDDSDTPGDDPTAAEFQRLLEEIESFEKDQQVAESAILVPQLSNSTQKRRRKKRGKYKPREKKPDTTKSVLLFDSTEEVDIGQGIIIQKGVLDFVRHKFESSPMKYLKNLLIKGGIFTLEELASHSLVGGKSPLNCGREKLNPIKLKAAVEYTKIVLNLREDPLKLIKFERNLKDLCPNARKELNNLKQKQSSILPT